MPDRTLVELAKRRPASPAALASERGIPERMRERDAQAVLAAIRAGLGDDPMSLPSSATPDVQARADALAPLAAAIVGARAEAIDLAPSLLATREDISRYLVGLIAGDGADSPLAAGWRHEIAGAALVDLVNGRIALASHPERPYLVEITRDPAQASG
jgi:ribonuclease D